MANELVIQDNFMFTSQVIFLKHLDGDIFKVKGYHIHGLLFRYILASHNSDIAQNLHQAETPNPYSLSYLYKYDDMYWIRIASWDKNISDAVFQFFLKNHIIRLGDNIFELLKTCCDKHEFVWADRMTPELFLEKIILDDKDEFWIQHFSATSFKCGDSHLCLPVPELLLNSIFRRLPTILKQQITISPKELVKTIHLKAHKLQSVYNRKGYGSIASFTGKTRWQINKNADQDIKRCLKILFHFSFFSGVGIKTTQGMGMCRII